MNQESPPLGVGSCQGYSRFVEKKCGKCKYAKVATYNLPCRECEGFDLFELKEEEEEKKKKKKKKKKKCINLVVRKESSSVT